MQATIDLTRAFELTVVAEGVEDRATWDTLARMGCERAQGHFISAAMPTTVFRQWLGAWDAAHPVGSMSARGADVVQLHRAKA